MLLPRSYVHSPPPDILNVYKRLAQVLNNPTNNDRQHYWLHTLLDAYYAAGYWFQYSSTGYLNRVHCLCPHSILCCCSSIIMNLRARTKKKVGTMGYTCTYLVKQQLMYYRLGRVCEMHSFVYTFDLQCHTNG